MTRPPWPVSIAALWLALACAGRDTSITHGADGAPEWSRRLAAAVPPGITADSARHVMEASNFHCRAGVDSVAYLWCDKVADKAIVQRRWQATVSLDAQQRVREVRGTTDLTGP